MNQPYLTAEEAAARLGVSLATLYAYVSRGLLRSQEVQEGSRQRRYPAEDVEALVARRRLRREPQEALEGSLHWGLPVLESGLTRIADGRLWYRGRDAVALARESTLEAVASLLWTGRLEEPRLEPAPGTAGRGLPLYARLQAALPAASAADPAAADLRPEAVARCGLRILGLLARAAAGRGDSRPRPVARTLARAWAPGHEGDLQAALILAADHELNVSAFAARCAASAGATPYGVVAAGLATLEGSRHGGVTRRVQVLFEEAARAGAARAVEERLRRGEEVPGFGHPLHPSGDPRGRALLEMVGDGLGAEVAEAGRRLLREEPTVDVGLVALAWKLGLPPDAPLALFALGRTVGWLAHALEQYADGRLIRPRARYVGPAPGG